MHTAFERTEHRPWPVPERAWSWRQSWCDLLFAHWPVPADRIRPLIPEPLQLQEHDGMAWIGVVPFRMEGVMHRPFPDMPYVSAFPELNVRTYVEYEGKPGVWFFSLDATNALAVWAARRFFHLPYHRAEIVCGREEGGGEFRYASTRHWSRASFVGTYAPTGPVYEARPGTLEHFLTERYCLYARSPKGELFRADVHHRPWPLQPAEARIRENTMGEQVGLDLSGPPTLLHFAHRIDVVVWSPERVHP
jgi:uncharacterized protein YqjF (DUF2071 family)